MLSALECDDYLVDSVGYCAEEDEGDDESDEAESASVYVNSGSSVVGGE